MSRCLATHTQLSSDQVAAMATHKIRCTEQMHNVTTILVQGKEDKTVLGGFDLSSLDGNTNPGDALAAILRQCGFDFSPDGKKLWRSGIIYLTESFARKLLAMFLAVC